MGKLLKRRDLGKSGFAQLEEKFLKIGKLFP
jgi:hypothetical protein